MIRAVVAVLCFALVPAAWATDIAEGGYVYCASEGGPCMNNGIVAQNVRYGAGEYWVTYPALTPGDSIYCSSTDFGTDPYYGHDKYCYMGTATGSAPTGPAPEFNWSDTSHLAQGAYVMALCAMCFAGFRSGDRL